MPYGTRLLTLLALTSLSLATSACVHYNVTFDEDHDSWRYETDARRLDVRCVAVIDSETLDRRVPVKSAMTGLANTWDVSIGDMLRQVTDLELPQSFLDYRRAQEYQEPAGPGTAMTVTLTVPRFTFVGLSADLTLHAVARSNDPRLTFERDYLGHGAGRTDAVLWGGAFAMKSAIRTSTLQAYRQAFAALREDFESALREAPPAE